MSFEKQGNETSRKPENMESKGLFVHALVALTNGVLMRLQKSESENGFFVDALEKATRTRKVLAEFDTNGELGDLLERRISHGAKKMFNHFNSSQ